MSGPELYDLWVEANQEEDIKVDDWVDVDPVDRACWETMASKITSYIVPTCSLH